VSFNIGVRIQIRRFNEMDGMGDMAAALGRTYSVLLMGLVYPIATGVFYFLNNKNNIWGFIA
jgi:hypothetical protein